MSRRLKNPGAHEKSRDFLAEFNEVFTARQRKTARRRLTPPRPQVADVDDWDQDAAIRLIDRLRRTFGSKVQSAGAVAGKVLRQAYIDLVRRDLREARYAGSFPVSSETEDASPVDRAIAALEERYSRFDLTKLFDYCWSARDLEVLTLLVVHRLSVEQAARRLHVQVETVKDRLRDIGKRVPGHVREGWGL